MSMNNANHPISVLITQGSMAASLAATGVMYLPKKSKLVSLAVIDAAGIAASDADYITVELKKGATLIASLDTRAAEEGALTANVAKLASLVSGQEEQDAGSSLTLTVTLNGTAVVTRGSIVLTYHPL